MRSQSGTELVGVEKATLALLRAEASEIDKAHGTAVESADTLVEEPEGGAGGRSYKKLCGTQPKGGGP